MRSLLLLLLSHEVTAADDDARLAACVLPLLLHVCS
jgi:hypothetical protein